MPTYELNEAAVRQARSLIDDGKTDTTTEWSDAAPSADDGNDVIEEHGYDGYGAWHLAIDPDASEETKGRYAFPYGDFRRSTGPRSSTPSSGPPRTTTTPSRRPPTTCCSGWTTPAAEPPRA